MTESKMEIYKNYFKNRGVDSAHYNEYKLPSYLLNEIDFNAQPVVLDIGCGFGQMLNALKEKKLKYLEGIELLPEAVKYCKEKLQLNVECTGDITGFAADKTARYDLILMSHVLEHLPKESIIPSLAAIRNMLKPKGKLILMVPNGQAPINSYWMWEDFTHHLLFTSGSIAYVLKAAGFEKITFLDPHDLQDKPAHIRLVKKIFQFIYRKQKSFWNSINSSGYHSASPVIYAWELRVKAENQ
jgi:2-polyprenyl-3-methyl-5-hydroxy-6-metoxy-1,4-benzoquinol methylase